MRTMTMPTTRTAGALALALVLAPASGWAQANCRNTGAFEPWLAAFKREALAQGSRRPRSPPPRPISCSTSASSASTAASASSPRTFSRSPTRCWRAAAFPTVVNQIKKHAALFARVDTEFGVPASVITAFWGLESDFGSGQGKDHSIKSLATLAYDCRRPEMFRGHLLDALRLIERGDLRAEEMIGSWAGELGQTQMMPSEYMAHAIDYDGDGRRNLIRSVPDVLGSTGKYLVHLGWKRGEPWLQEIRVPANLPWKEADL